jgi:hypothetical protein
MERVTVMLSAMAATFHIAVGMSSKNVAAMAMKYIAEKTR